MLLLCRFLLRRWRCRARTGLELERLAPSRGPPPGAARRDRAGLRGLGRGEFRGGCRAGAIRRGVHKSVQALEADIRDWVEQRNQNPRPFAWTKTAEEILNSLAEYLSKISGAAH